MDKSIDLFLQGDHDNATALDDLLPDPEKPLESIWGPFKSDILTPDEAQLEETTIEEKASTTDSMDDVSYMQDIVPTKQEATFLHSTSTNGATFGTFSCAPKEASVDPRQRNFCLPPHPPLENFVYASEEPSALSSGGSAMNSIESFDKYQFDQCSEKGGSMNDTNGRAEERIRGMLNNLMIYSTGVDFCDMRSGSVRKEVQKPPTTAGIGLDDLKAVFHMERPKAEKKLRLKRTTFSNLSRHYGISKWPFRTIRDAKNRMTANEILLSNRSVSKERRRKIMEQQRLLEGVIALIYADPRESRDSNTLAVLLRIVAARESPSTFSEL